MGGSGTSIIGWVYFLIFIVILVAGAVLWGCSKPNAWEFEVIRRKKRAWKAAARFEGKSKGKDVKRMLSNSIRDGDEKRFDDITADWKKKTDDYVLSVKQNNGPRPFNVENNGEGGFDGWLIQKIGWNILGGLITLITLGIAYPVTIIWKEKWRCKHTLYEGRRLTFDGRASQLIGNWLLWLLLVIVTFGIFCFFIPGKIKKWKARHTHISGEYFEFGATFDGWLIQEILIKFFGIILSVCTLGLALPVALSVLSRWKCNHTVLDGKRLYFDGKAGQLFGKYILWWLLCIVTFTVYAWFIPNRFSKWRAKHTLIEKEYELC